MCQVEETEKYETGLQICNTVQMLSYYAVKINLAN